MVEEARDGSSYDVRRITEAEAEEVMAGIWARYL
jgi:hypothetical protein